MNRVLTVLLVIGLAASVGCASKDYVKQQTTPLINKTNELDDLTAKNTRDIKDVEARAQAGIQRVQTKAAEADQKAQAASQQADQAQTSATNTGRRVDRLQTVVVNLDNYHVATETSVTFGSTKDMLTQDAKAALDQLVTAVPNTKDYIFTVEGNTDYYGTSAYNYDLSDRRADAVVQYLAAEHKIPAYKIYVIGLGKEKPVDSNKTNAGRAKNRRVDVRLMTNTVDSTAPVAATNVPLGQSQ